MYIYLPIDKPVTLPFMQPPKISASASRQKEYARLCAQLAHIGWISEGYVQDRGPGAGGPCYPWTRKVKGKTVCVALSKEQYEWLKQAIANWRTVQKTLRQMQRLSREELFQSVPGPKRRKKLSKLVLGLV
jgi:cyclopropane fatty-acyl-phospholipid synthase-like methyltransferase